MRAVFIGAGELTSLTAQQLLKYGYEVVIVEQDKARIDELRSSMRGELAQVLFQEKA